MGTPRSTAGKLILPATQNRCAFAPEWLPQHATAHDLANIKRVGITSHKALGVSVANIRVPAQQLGRISTKDRHSWSSQQRTGTLGALLVPNKGQALLVL
jgi:hypothetical protein